MFRWILLVLIISTIHIKSYAQAEEHPLAVPMLADLDFTTGRWEMVGVTLHNYKLLPIQEEIGTFVMASKEIMKEMQQTWRFPQIFDDFCDFHYALKFYRDGKLVKTLRLNLDCNYISIGGISYRFDKQLFLKYRYAYKRVSWSRINFKNLVILREAVKRIEAMPNTYMYFDVRPYDFDGYFTIGANGFAWNVDRDSVKNAFIAKIQHITGSNQFYLIPGVYYMKDKDLCLRYEVYCNKDVAMRYRQKDMITDWQAHQQYSETVQIIVVGISRKDYQTIMKDYLDKE